MIYTYDALNGIGDPRDPIVVPGLQTATIKPVVSTNTPAVIIPSYVPTTPTAGGGKAVNWEQVKYWADKGVNWAMDFWKNRQAVKNNTYNGSGINPGKTNYVPPTPPAKDNNNTMLMVGGLGILLLIMNKKKKA